MEPGFTLDVRLDSLLEFGLADLAERGGEHAESGITVSQLCLGKEREQVVGQFTGAAEVSHGVVL